MIGNTALDMALKEYSWDTEERIIKRKIVEILRKNGKVFKKCENVVKKSSHIDIVFSLFNRRAVQRLWGPYFKIKEGKSWLIIKVF